MKLHVVSQDQGLHKLRVSGDITQLEFSFHDEPIQGLIGPEGYRQKVLLGLADARMIDSRGVGWLLHCHRRFQEAGGSLILHSIPPMVENVFQLLKMQLIFKMASDETTAEQMAAGVSS